MNSEYIRALWRNVEETLAHEFIEEVYGKKGFTVKNYHKNDRVHECGIDILCRRERSNSPVGFAVKKKPRKDDIRQLETLASEHEGTTKFYVYLDFPTRPFERIMRQHRNVHYLNWEKFNSLLILNGSIGYIMLYFSAHPLYANLTKMYDILYRNRNASYYPHNMNVGEAEFLWSLKDDAVKLKAIAEYIMGRWRPRLLSATQYTPKQYPAHIEDLHSELDIVNSIAGHALSKSFLQMEEQYPHLIGKYWNIVRYRTVWKEFTATTMELGKTSKDLVDGFILYKWILPSVETSRRSSHYYPMKSVYSALWALIENTYNLADDIENGIDWLHHDLLHEK